MIAPIQIAKDGPTFSRLVFGVMKWGIWGHNLSPKEVVPLITESIELGVTTFDHADIYGHYTTEALFGEAMRMIPSMRQKMQLVTKCGIKMLSPNRPSHQLKSYDTSQAHILQSVENSLRFLRTDYVDLLLIHRPSPLMQPDEVAEAFTKLKQSGKVLHFGVSNFTPSQFDLINSRFPLVTNQIEASLLHLYPFVNGALDQMMNYEIAPMAWSPLGGGRVFKHFEDEQVQRVRLVANSLGRKYGDMGIDQVILAWLLKHPSNILPVLGTGRIERLEASVRTLDFEMPMEDWFKLWEASVGEEVP